MRIALHVLHYYADYCLSILASKMREKAISGMQEEAVREVSKRKLKATDVGILCIVCGVSHNNATHSLHTYCFANFY